MADFGVTSAGFKPKRLADLLASLNADLSKVQDPVSGEYLNPATDPLVSQLCNILMPALADCWDAAAQLSTQFDPLKATGALLAGLVQLNGIQKFPGTPTQVVMQLTGVGSIPAGQLIGTDDTSMVFATDEDITLSGSPANVTATCQENGAHTPAVGTIVNILTPLPGWVSAQNIGIVSIGSEPETNAQLRLRQQIETTNTGYRQIESIYASVKNIPGVTYARAYQNRKQFDIDSRGLPPKTVAVVVQGASDETVATAIAKRVPAGMEYFGNTSVTLTDMQGLDEVVSFIRPVPVVVNVVVNITVVDDSFPGDGAEQIANAIAAMQFVPGADVYASRMYTPANTVAGHEIDSITVARYGGSPSTVLAAIGWNEIASLVQPDKHFAFDSLLAGWDRGYYWVNNAPLSSITVNVTRP